MRYKDHTLMALGDKSIISHNKSVRFLLVMWVRMRIMTRRRRTIRDKLSKRFKEK